MKTRLGGVVSGIEAGWEVIRKIPVGIGLVVGEAGEEGTAAGCDLGEGEESYGWGFSS